MQGGYEVIVVLPVVLEGHSVPEGSLECSESVHFSDSEEATLHSLHTVSPVKDRVHRIDPLRGP